MSPEPRPVSREESRQEQEHRNVAAATENVLEGADATLLDLVDNLLDRGVMVHGELILGIAGIDLVYLRLSLLLCAADRMFGVKPGDNPSAKTTRRPS